MGIELTSYRYSNPAKLVISELAKRLPDVWVTAVRPSPEERPVEKGLLVEVVEASTTNSPTQKAEILLFAFAGTYDEVWEVTEGVRTALIEIFVATDNPIAYVNPSVSFTEVEVEEGYIVGSATVSLTLLPDETIKTPLI